MSDIAQLVRDFNAGKEICPDDDLTLWQCELCGIHYAKESEAEDCEWLCRHDPE